MDDLHGYSSIAVSIIMIASIVVLGIMLVGVAKRLMKTSMEYMETSLVEQEHKNEQVANSTYDDGMDIVGIIVDKDKGTANLVKQPSKEETTTGIIVNSPNYNIKYDAPANENTGMWVAICFGIVGFVVIVIAVLAYKFHKDKEEREHTEYVLDKDLRTIASDEVELLKKKY